MIKQKRSIMLLCLTLLIGAIMALSACGNDKDKPFGEVSDLQWQEKLDINIDACKSCSVKVVTGANYDKSAAAEYGEWKMLTETLKIDFENEVVYEVTEQERYVPTTDDFSKTTYEFYYFRYKDNYYKYCQEFDEVTSITKAEFLHEAETLTNIVSQIQIYAQPIMKNLFKFNSKTQCYDLMQVGTQKLSFQFWDSGVKMIMEMTSVDKAEDSIFNIDNTVVTIPDYIKAKVDEFTVSKQ